ncbi:MAG TPA: pyruvate formate lyase family protein [Clostridia bacterium]|nr:pyruvate formate lyase family protein [Clostridia bacterium]
MSSLNEIETPVWGTFDEARKHLENQFEETVFDAATGLSAAELEQAVEDYLSKISSLPKVIQKAEAYRIIVTRGQIAIDPLDWFADKLDHGNILRKLCGKWQMEVETSHLPEETEWLNQARKIGTVDAVLDLGHLTPGWTFMFENGLLGLLANAEGFMNALGGKITEEQRDFYHALEIVYNATIEFAGRLSRLAEQMVPANPQHRQRLLTVSRALGKIPANPPESFHEALQFYYLMHQLIEMEGENIRSMCGFDRMMYPYYKADIEAGRLTREQAKELIKFFFTKFFANTKGRDNGKNFYFAGQYPDGSSAVNELSWLALEVYEELKTTDPKLSVRFFQGTPDDFMRRVADIIRNGQTSFVLVNDEAAIPALLKRGKTLEEARSYTLIGCYEPAVEGREIACNMSIKVNLAKGVEMALNNGTDPASGVRFGPETGDPGVFKTFDEFYEAYLKQTDYQIGKAMSCIKAFEAYWPEINPSPLLAGTMIDCLKKGKDVGQHGPEYNNTGCMGLSLGNAVDSLISVKTLVFDEKRISMNELAEVLKKNYEGEEQLRQYILHRVPKWGNDHPEADELAKKVTDWYTARVNGSRNNRGGWFQASMFSLTYRWSLGKYTGALPDGRKAGMPLSPGLNAMTGMDKKGVTALVNSVTKLDFSEIPNGSVVDINLHPSAVKGTEGLDAFVALIRTFFAKGGYALQFNIFDTEMLRDAQRDPERYSTLQIRVTGWNVYFVTLSEYEQNQFIEENKHVF